MILEKSVMKIHLNTSLNLPKKEREKDRNHWSGLLKLLVNQLKLQEK